jgi:cysteine-rich CWC protein
MQPLPTTTCPLCHGPNECAAAISGGFAAPCWCSPAKLDAPVLARIPEHERNRSCVCRACALLGGGPSS